MKYLFTIIFAVSFFLTGCNKNDENKLEGNDAEGVKLSTQEIEEMQNISAKFMGRLKSTLMTQMQEGGVTSALSVCSDSAQIITNDFAEKEGINIKRISEKFRNPKNEPNKIEKEILEKFAELHSNGNLTEKDYEVDIQDGKTVFMKPIFIQAPCLNCHGDESQMKEPVKAMLNNKYPNDLAKNYQIGDFRGAVVITKEN